MPKFRLYDSKYEGEEDFSKNKRQRLYKLNDTFDSIPLHERTDQFPSSASAINEGLDFVPRFIGTDKPTRIDEKEFKYQNAAKNFRGARIIRTDNYNYKVSKKDKFALSAKRYSIDEDHLLNVGNESRYGLHGINRASRDIHKTQDPKTFGASNHTRYAGMERHRLPEFNPELPRSIPESMVEPNIPNRDVFRFNDKTIEDYPQAFPPYGF